MPKKSFAPGFRLSVLDVIVLVVGVSTAIALSLIEMRKPSYHGVGWRRINPDLPAWWESEMLEKRSE